MEQFRNKFIEEAADLVQNLEKSLLELSSDISNTDQIEVIFRVMHSLKGGSAMFGFNKIDALTHVLESAYDQIRKGKKGVDNILLDVTFKSIDHIKVLLAEGDELSQRTLDNHTLLMNNINSLAGEDRIKISGQTAPDISELSPKVSDIATWYISFSPRRDIFKNGTNPLLIINELVSLGQSKTYCFINDIPDLNSINVHSCYASWIVILATDVKEETISDVFMFVDNDCELAVRKISDCNLIADSNFINLFDQKHNINHKLQVSEIETFLNPIYNKSVSTKTEESLSGYNKSKEQNISSIRVSSEKLDELINLVSELVTRQAGLTLISESLNNKELLIISEDIEKITRRLRDSTFGIRLIPIENMVTRFQRLVRELSIELNKDIIFQTEGTDTELDKTMIEGLIDPLMHIIRNSIDHGIENPETRKAKGKNEKGKILLKAFYSGANVYMQVSDDGQGIDTVKIFNHAVKQGIIPADTMPGKKEIFDLLFLPGFSTAKDVTKISGRGVGMDVVKRKITELRGEVTVDSEINKGTTITIKLPLTLSIIDGLLVTIDKSFFVIPLSAINRCVEFRHEDLINPVNNLIFIKDQHIPFAYLRKEFEFKSPAPEYEQIIVIEFGDTLFGLAVDHVVGEYQAVLKSLGTMYKNQDIISGATILGDGTVALLLDPNKIISRFTYKMEEGT